MLVTTVQEKTRIALKRGKDQYTNLICCTCGTPTYTWYVVLHFTYFTLEVPVSRLESAVSWIAINTVGEKEHAECQAKN